MIQRWRIQVVDAVVKIFGIDAFVDGDYDTIGIVLNDVFENAKECSIFEFVFSKILTKYENQAFGSAHDFLVLTTHLINRSTCCERELMNLEISLVPKYFAQKLFVYPILVESVVANRCVVRFAAKLGLIIGT
jgi:hypothetical protein